LANDKVFIYDTDNTRLNVYTEGQTNLTVINDNPSVEIIKIFETGPQGPRGLDGQAQIPNLVVTSSQQIDYYFIQNAPFYPVISGSLFASTASFAFNGYLSSSLVPWEGEFNVGSATRPWKNIYATGSIYIGNFHISTSSILVSQQVLFNENNGNQQFYMRSGSVSSSFDNGMFIVSDFNSLPISIRGGLIISGSDLFVGI
jgi:hypothetical protein